MNKKIKSVFILLAVTLGLTSCSNNIVNQEQASTASKVVQNKSEDIAKHINKNEEKKNKNDSLNNVNKKNDEKKNVITEKDIKGKEKQNPEKKIKKTAIKNSSKKPKKNAVDKKKSVDKIIKNVYNGKYGNGEERFRKLKAEGYNPKEIQEKIDKIESDKQRALQKQNKESKKIVSTKKKEPTTQETKKSESDKKNTKPVKTQKVTPKYSKEQVVSMVLNGKLGNGDARKRAIEKLGFNYKEIQGLINKRTKVSTPKSSKKITYKSNDIFNRYPDNENVMDLVKFVQVNHIGSIDDWFSCFIDDDELEWLAGVYGDEFSECWFEYELIDSMATFLSCYCTTAPWEALACACDEYIEEPDEGEREYYTKTLAELT